MDSLDVYEVLVKQHESMLLAYALGLTHDPALAEEVVQEAFVIGFEKLDKLRNKASFAAWIRTIARNLAFAELRRRNREVPVDEQVLSGMDEVFSRFDAPLSDETWDDRVKVIRECFDHLPEKLRDVTRLHYFEDLSLRQITERLAVSLDAVKKRLERARDAIRDCAEKRLSLENI